MQTVYLIESETESIARVNTEAHAKLIAAAPELLEALCQCVTEDGATAWKSAQFAGQRIEAISHIARAAIAKATEGN